MRARVYIRHASISPLLARGRTDACEYFCVFPTSSLSLPRADTRLVVSCHVETYEREEDWSFMELELGLALPAPAGEVDLLNGAPGSCGKRGFGEAFGAKATLPLFVCEDGDGRGGGDDAAGAGDWETSAKRKKLVGWPPVKCAHRRNGGGGYVKVKMEGVAIGRKVDLSLHSSYEELLDTLDRMFPSTNQDAREESNRQDGHHRRHPYAVTYEDGDGDWMQLADVPWEAFVKSVKRLKILV